MPTPSSRARRRIEHVGTTSQLGHADEQPGVEPELADLPLETHEVARRELVEQPLAVLLVDAQPGEQRRVQGGVAEADAVAIEPDGVEGVAQNRQRLGGPLRRRRADQFDPRLQELAHLAAARRTWASAARMC